MSAPRHGGEAEAVAVAPEVSQARYAPRRRPGTRRGLMAARQANTPWIPREVLERIPVEWGLGRPTQAQNQGKGKEGWRWEDPKSQGNGIRIDKGNPYHSLQSQRDDHTIVRFGGRPLTRNGLKLAPGARIARNPVDTHIPMRKYRNWVEWNRK